MLRASKGYRALVGRRAQSTGAQPPALRDAYLSGTSLLGTLYALGADLPYFCYSPAGGVLLNCRACIIRWYTTVENQWKYGMSCSLTNVYTYLGYDLRLPREAFFELELLRHPLDCPICDSSGECDLQDMTDLFGSDRSRDADPQDAGHYTRTILPGVALDVDKCIHCRKCVELVDRLAVHHGHPNAKVLEFAHKAVDRELLTHVVTPLGHTITSPITLDRFSRNSKPPSFDVVASVNRHFSHFVPNPDLVAGIINQCPVGALTASEESHMIINWDVDSPPFLSCDFSRPSLPATTAEIKENRIRRRQNVSEGGVAVPASSNHNNQNRLRHAFLYYRDPLVNHLPHLVEKLAPVNSPYLSTALYYLFNRYYSDAVHPLHLRLTPRQMYAALQKLGAKVRAQPSSPVVGRLPSSTPPPSTPFTHHRVPAHRVAPHQATPSAQLGVQTTALLADALAAFAGDRSWLTPFHTDQGNDVNLHPLAADRAIFLQKPFQSQDQRYSVFAELVESPAFKPDLASFIEKYNARQPQPSAAANQAAGLPADQHKRYGLPDEWANGKLTRLATLAARGTFTAPPPQEAPVTDVLFVYCDLPRVDPDTWVRLSTGAYRIFYIGTPWPVDHNARIVWLGSNASDVLADLVEGRRELRATLPN